MNIKQQVKENIVKAMKEKNNKERDFQRMLMDRIQKKEKELKRDATDDEVVALFRTFKKQIEEEAFAYFQSGNVVRHDELVQDIVILIAYLPREMSGEEIKHLASTVVSQLESQSVTPNKGNVMKLIMPMVKGKADNRLVMDIVNSIFA